MDSRIEELNNIIAERCNSYSLTADTEKREIYLAIKEYSWRIYKLLEDYRLSHPEEY